MIRTGKVPFIQSRPSLPLLISTLTVGIVAVIVGFSDLAIGIDMHPLPFAYIPWLILILGSYFLSTQLVKHMYIKKFGDWL
jgi:Mg2+-importing ATPase